MAKIKPYLLGALVGLLVGAACVFAIARIGNAGLRSTIENIKTSLGSALLDSGDIAESIRLIRKESANKDRLIAEQQSGLDRQQRLIEAQQRGLSDIAEKIQTTGSDIGRQIRIFAEGFRRLYAIYNASPE